MVTFAVIATSVYFVGFGAGFLVRPAFAEQMGLAWTNKAGKTEVRCYYGAISWALAAFLLYLLHAHLGREALTGATFLAGAVFTSRVIGTAVDGGWSDRYTKTAIPLEGLFVIALLASRWI